MVAPLVPAVRAQPVPPRTDRHCRRRRARVVDGQHPPATETRPGLGDPCDRGVEQRGPGAVRRSRGEYRRTRIERRREHLAERAVGPDHHERLPPPGVEHAQPERDVVEQLVGDDHAVERALGQVGPRLDAGGVMLTLRVRDLDCDVVRRGGARWSGGVDRPGERAGPRPGIDDDERRRRAERAPDAVEVAAEDGAEQRPDLGRRDEIAAAPTGAPAVPPGVEPVRSVRARGAGTRRRGSRRRPPRSPPERSRPRRPGSSLEPYRSPECRSVPECRRPGRGPCRTRVGIRNGQARPSTPSPSATEPSGPASSPRPGGTISRSAVAGSTAAT